VTKKLFVVVAVLGLTSVAIFGQAKPSIQGVWRVAERTTTGPTAATNKNPQPSLYIFTAKHYSMMQDSSVKPRPMVEGLGAGATAKLTDAEMMTRYREWAPVQANSGTYEVKGNTLTVRPAIAKSTAVMASKTGASYQFKMDGDSLWLIAVIGPTGEKSVNPTTLKLTRVE
jgi:hypothetical protein